MQKISTKLVSKNLAILAVLLFAGLFAFSQSLTPTVVASGGGFTENGGYSLSYTIGEPVIATIGSGSNILTQGFQQPRDAMQVSIDDEILAEIKWDVDVFPNPFGDMLNVRIDMPEGTRPEVVLYNLLGVRMEVPMDVELNQGKKSYVLNGANLAQGIYFVNVYDQSLNKPLTFKVIKL